VAIGCWDVVTVVVREGTDARNILDRDREHQMCLGVLCCMSSLHVVTPFGDRFASSRLMLCKLNLGVDKASEIHMIS
jgi:hypothetical protein